MDERLIEMLQGLQRLVFKKTHLGMHRVDEDKNGISVITFSPIDDRRELADNRIVILWEKGSSVVEVTGGRLERFRQDIEQWVLEHTISGEQVHVKN